MLGRQNEDKRCYKSIFVSFSASKFPFVTEMQADKMIQRVNISFRLKAIRSTSHTPTYLFLTAMGNMSSPRHSPLPNDKQGSWVTWQGWERGINFDLCLFFFVFLPFQVTYILYNLTCLKASLIKTDTNKCHILAQDR